MPEVGEQLASLCKEISVHVSKMLQCSLRVLQFGKDENVASGREIVDMKFIERTSVSNNAAVDNGLRYEVALEVLGQSRQPFMQAVHDEQSKPAPSKPFILYCEMRLKALDELQDDLQPTDLDTIERILNRDDLVFGPR